MSKDANCLSSMCVFVCLCTHGTEVRVLGDVLCDSRIRGRQRHDEQQSVSGLLTNRTLSERREAVKVCFLLDYNIF